MKEQEFAIGVDLGGTNTVVGFVNNRGDCVEEISFPTQTKDGPQKYIEELADRIAGMHGRIPQKSECMGLGIAAPHVSYSNGMIVAPANLDWGPVNLISLLAERFDLPVAALNDANAAALGEMGCGAARGLTNFVLVTLGTGIGSGVVAAGHLLTGARGLAGEFGHMIAVRDGRECGCGRRGCIETYASARGIVRTALELMSQRNTATMLANERPADLTSERIYIAAKNGDLIARTTFDKTARILGGTLADLAACVDPEAIILSGGVMRAGETLLDPVKKYFEDNLLYTLKEKIPILPSMYPEGQAAVIGACLWLRQQIGLAGEPSW